MLRYVLKRASFMLVTLWVIVTVTFFIMHFLPGTPLANEQKIPPAIRDQIMAEYGLDQPLSVQYVQFLGKTLRGDLGISLAQDGRPVSEMILNGLFPSFFIGMQAILFGTIIGLILGIVAALRRGTWIDSLATGTAIFGVSVPNFVLGALLSYFVGVKLGWLPAALWGTYQHTIMPSLALSFIVIAQISRYIRTEMAEVLDSDFMKTAKAKGLSRSTVVFRHALKNALIPAVTVLGPLSVNIITGSLVVETIFGVPGMGKLFVNSILTNDYTLIMGTTIFYSVLFITVMFLVDMLYGVIDPRIRVTSGVKE